MTANATQGRRWKPVRQQAADSFWLILIVANGITVIATRILLELTGYPQIGGGGEFHVAHVLWGGLLLFVAVSLPLTFANRIALWSAATLGGVGTGLFIDEVGKFITSSTDYFTPLAFPIIYAFIVACVWMYMRIRRRHPRDARTLLYHALEDMKQVLDNDLDPFEHRELVDELRQVAASATDANERHLGEALLRYAMSRDIRLSLAPNPLERLLVDARRLLAGTPPRRVLTGILVAGFGLLGVGAAVKLASVVALAQGTGPLRAALEGVTVQNGTTNYTLHSPLFFTIMTVAALGIGLLAMATAILLLAGRGTLALRVGVFALIVSLTIVAPLTFYFSQLYALVDVAGQLFLIGVASLYRWRFLTPTAATMGMGVRPGSPLPGVENGG
jgi:hypothetical protein